MKRPTRLIEIRLTYIPDKNDLQTSPSDSVIWAFEKPDIYFGDKYIALLGGGLNLRYPRTQVGRIEIFVIDYSQIPVSESLNCKV